MILTKFWLLIYVFASGYFAYTKQTHWLLFTSAVMIVVKLNEIQQVIEKKKSDEKQV